MGNLFTILLTVLVSLPGVAPPVDTRPPLVKGKTLRQWLIALHTSKGDARTEAIAMLTEFGPKAAEALPDLLAELDATEEDSCGRRAFILEAIAALGSTGKPAVPALVKLVRRADPRDSFTAQQVLASIGSGATDAVPELLRSLDSDRYNSLYRRHLPQTLIRIAGDNKAVQQRLRQAFRDYDFGVRLNAAHALWQVGDRGKDLADILEQGKRSPDRDVRLMAAQWLSEIAPSHPGAIADLLMLLGDTDAFVRKEVIHRLRKLRPRGKAAMQAYRNALKDEEFLIRGSAAEYLGDMGVEAQLAVEDLQVSLKDEHAMVRSAAAFSLWQINRVNLRLALESLCTSLDDESPYSRAHAADLLGKLGRDAKPVLPFLRKGLRDPWTDVRESTARAISTITRASP